jgi:hypothetical protein
VLPEPDPWPGLRCFAEDRAPNPSLVKVAERFQDRAQHRYLAAIRQLSTVRKLLRPALSPLDLATRPVSETVPHRSRLLFADGVTN